MISSPATRIAGRVCRQGRLRHEQGAAPDIEDALAKLDDGKFCLSEVSGRPIGFRRLRAIPGAPISTPPSSARTYNRNTRSWRFPAAPSSREPATVTVGRVRLRERRPAVTAFVFAGE
jgi:hypothetical protein